MEDNVPNSFLKLITLDLKHINLPIKAINHSEFFKNFHQDFPNAEIHLNQINYRTLAKIVEFLEHYINKQPKKIQRPLPKKDFRECVDEWDYKFINIDTEEIFELMLAANFLHIQALLDLTSAKIASMIRGKSPEEIRRILGMKNDIDENNENEIKEEID